MQYRRQLSRGMTEPLLRLRHSQPWNIGQNWTSYPADWVRLTKHQGSWQLPRQSSHA
jgi:hypothetical protein